MHAFPLLLLLLLLLLSSSQLCLAASEAPKELLLATKWKDEDQLQAAYSEATQRRRAGNAVLFHPDRQVMQGSFVVAVCSLAVDSDAGYGLRSAQLLHNDHIFHEVSVASPKRELKEFLDKADPLNYQQVERCQQRCHSAAALSNGGLAFFQFSATASTSGSYRCSGRIESLVSAEDRRGAEQTESMVSENPVRLQAYNSEIKSPQLHFGEFVAGRKMSAGCIENSRPASTFNLLLAFRRPDGAGGIVEDQLLVEEVQVDIHRLRWEGENATVGMHGSELVCRVQGGWGGERSVAGAVRVQYMYPVFFTNPRVQQQRRRHSDFRVVTKIFLRRGEYVVCSVDGYP